MFNCSASESEKCHEEGEMYIFPLFFKIFWYICYGVISVLATAGNGLVIWTIVGSRRMRNVTNYYIANLAFADFILAIFVIPFEFQAALDQRWRLPDFMCSFCPFVQSVTINVSIYTLTAIAVDRHRAILKPFAGRSSKLKCQIVIAFIWTISILMSAPIGYAMEVEESYYGSPFCFPKRLTDNEMTIYRSVMLILQYVIPLIIIGWTYIAIGLALWGNSAPGNAQTDRDAALMRTKKRVIKMLILVVTLFALCWLPLHTYNVIYHLYPEFRMFKYTNVVFFCIDWFAMSNACYNPFIYAIYNEKFKHEFEIRMGQLRLRAVNKRTVLRRELSLFSSGRYDWKYNSTRRDAIATPTAETLIKESPTTIA